MATLTLTKVLLVVSLLRLALRHSKSSQQTLFVSSSPRRSDWSTLDLDDLEEAWMKGDDAQDLLTPDEHLYDLLEQERKLAFDKMQSLMQDKTSGKRHDKALKRAALDAQHAGKSVMMFASLRNDRSPKHGHGWDWDSMVAVCDEWSNWLSNALVDISCYPIEPKGSDDADASSILITSARSWDGEDIFRFLVEHHHPKRLVSEVKWNDRVTKL
ncbi:hypothetical protein ACHAWU_000542 [Discostella pseudostelligera]|uniref:Uncharacterized protein n=1 Tax=Discostella pseudostelligera TaxID=259834 RepID=A0ABD3N801_9STRA